MAATPTAMQTKKKSNRRQAARVSRTAIWRMNFIRLHNVNRRERGARRIRVSLRTLRTRRLTSCLSIFSYMLDDAAIAQDHPRIGDGRQFRIVGNQDNGRPARAMDFAQQFQNMPA